MRWTKSPKLWFLSRLFVLVTALLYFMPAANSAIKLYAADFDAIDINEYLKSQPDAAYNFRTPVLLSTEDINPNGIKKGESQNTFNFKQLKSTIGPVSLNMKLNPLRMSQTSLVLSLDLLRSYEILQDPSKFSLAEEVHSSKTALIKDLKHTLHIVMEPLASKAHI
jgi:hypothetical protein